MKKISRQTDRSKSILIHPENSVSDPEIFTFKGSQILFKLLSTAAEMQDGDGLQKYGKKNKSMSFKGLLTNIAQSKMADISKMAKSGS